MKKRVNPNLQFLKDHSIPANKPNAKKKPIQYFKSIKKTNGIIESQLPEKQFPGFFNI
jgi:hypothetical protein